MSRGAPWSWPFVSRLIRCFKACVCCLRADCTSLGAFGSGGGDLGKRLSACALVFSFCCWTCCGDGGLGADDGCPFGVDVVGEEEEEGRDGFPLPPVVGVDLPLPFPFTAAPAVCLAFARVWGEDVSICIFIDAIPNWPGGYGRAGR